MENQELQSRLEAIEKRLSSIETSVTRTYRIIFWGGVITVALFVLPLLGIALVAPSFLSSYAGTLDASSLDALQ